MNGEGIESREKELEKITLVVLIKQKDYIKDHVSSNRGGRNGWQSSPPRILPSWTCSVAIVVQFFLFG